MLSNKQKQFNIYGYTNYAFTKKSIVSSYHLWQNLGLSKYPIAAFNALLFLKKTRVYAVLTLN